MDAVAYQMSFDKEQLALLCANYDRRIDSLDAENKRLKAENAKLRGARDVWQENDAKLRELVSVLAHCAADSGCDSCPINGGCAQVGELDLCETVHDRMRELGVEVDDA